MKAEHTGERLKKFARDQLADITSELELTDEVFEAVTSLNNEVQILNFFAEHTLWDEAIKLLSLGLPKREAIWWALICIESLPQSGASPHQTEHLQRIIKEWVFSPSETIRIQAGEISNKANFYTSEEWLITAVFWSGGSIASASQPGVEPAAYQCGQAIYNSIALAAELSGTPSESFKMFLRKGLHIAMGGNGKV